jgi:hypothetical protein
MEELIKILNIRQIEYLYLKYIDNNGNFKKVEINYPSERLDVEEDE